MRAAFPRYNYDDMVQAQYRLFTEGLGLRHLRLVLGNSMGGMHTWIWATKHPDFMDTLVPMASQPTEMASRNWMMRRQIIDTIRNDPDWNNGNYATQPRAFRTANVFFAIATNSGTLAYQKLAPPARRPTSCSTAALRRSLRPTPTTSCTWSHERARTSRVSRHICSAGTASSRICAGCCRGWCNSRACRCDRPRKNYIDISIT
jgi:homoserine acetyltransferase